MIDLLDQIRKKDKGAVSLLYTRYGKNLYGYAVAKWKLEEDEAWDLVYKTLYHILEVAERYSFESEKKFAGFVFTAFVNNLRNHYQKKKKTAFATVELSDRHGSHGTGNEEEAPASPHMNCLQQALGGMEEWKRILLLMRAQDHSYEEIAAYVDKPAGQLKVYYMRLKKLLTEMVNECVNRKK